MNERSKTARSYRTGIIDDNFSLHINIKWLGQMFVLIAGLVYSYYQVIHRIGELERRVELSDTNIEELVSKHIIEEEKKMTTMQEQLEWYQKELNLNPLSWSKKRKKK